jgi:hypothetical protein
MLCVESQFKGPSSAKRDKNHILKSQIVEINFSIICPSTLSSPKWYFPIGSSSWHVLPTCHPCHTCCSVIYQYTMTCELHGIEMQTPIPSALVSVKGKHMLLSIS